MRIRPATAEDMAAVNDIYNQAVTDTTASFDLEPKTLESRMQWFATRRPLHPVVVTEEDGRVVGWAALSPVSDRAAWDPTAEIAIYVDRECHRTGIGSALGQHIIEAARAAGLHVLIARICSENAASIEMTRRLGFTEAGTLHEVGHKFGRWLDVVMFELRLG